MANSVHKKITKLVQTDHAIEIYARSIVKDESGSVIETTDEHRDLFLPFNQNEVEGTVQFNLTKESLADLVSFFSKTISGEPLFTMDRDSL